MYRHGINETTQNVIMQVIRMFVYKICFSYMSLHVQVDENISLKSFLIVSNLLLRNDTLYRYHDSNVIK